MSAMREANGFEHIADVAARLVEEAKKRAEEAREKPEKMA